jgi:hypothetical protein
MEDKRKRNIFAGFYLISLTIVSMYIVADGAGGEPYLEFHFLDAFLQVGVAVCLMILWVLAGGWVVYGVARHRLIAPWLGLAILAAIALFYLWDCPIGYIGDLARYHH